MLMRKFFGLTGLLIFLLICSMAWAGTIKGKITDLSTEEPIAGAKISVEGKDKSVHADENGEYEVQGVSGDVNLAVRATGYRQEKRKVTVPADGEVAADFSMELSGAQTMEEMVVTDRKLVDEAPQTSSHSFTIDEVKDNAGAFQDVAKAMKTLPGVVSNSDFSADMYVRGSENYENLIMIDGFWFLNPYHFGAGLSVINTDLVDKFTFYTGGFPAQYPFASGSILDVKYKDGNKERTSGSAEISLLSADGYVAGHISKTSTWIVSARRSYFDYLMKILDMQDVMIPVFSDLFVKMTYDPAPAWRFDFMALRSEDGVTAKLPDNPTPVKEGKIYYHNLTNNFFLNVQFSPNKYFMSSTSGSVQFMDTDANVSESSTPLNVNSKARVWYTSEDVTVAVPRNVIKAGLDYARLDLDLVGRILFTDFVPGGRFSGEMTSMEGNYKHNNPLLFYGGYAQDEVEILKDRWRINAGVRLDHYESNGEGTDFSPRVSSSWTVHPGTVIRAAWGIYYVPPFNILATDKTYGNPNLRSEKSTHYVVGLDQAIKDDMMLRVEGYFKEFDDLQFQEWNMSSIKLGNMEIPLPNPATDINWFNSGYGQAAGIEIFFQKKKGGWWDGWLSYTLGEVIYNDGLGQYGYFAPFQDQRHTLNLVANFRPTDLWVFSFDFSLASGRPYTPIIGWKKQFSETFFEVWQPVFGRINSVRYPTRHKLDIRVEKLWRLPRKVDLSAFAEVYNVYNQRNVYTYFYGPSETDPGRGVPVRKTVYDLPIIPFTGVKVDF